LRAEGWGLGLRAQGLGLRAEGLGLRAEGLGTRLGLSVEIVGYRE
jgi:hypothetical protein